MKSIAGEIERLKHTVNENPQSAQFARLAEYLFQANRIPEAIEICKRGLEYHPNYANAHFVLGQCYFRTKDFDAAESEFNKVLLHDPEHVQAHHLQAKIMKERGWSNAYLLWLKRAVTIDPLDKLSQSLIDDYSEEEMELEEQSTDNREIYSSAEETFFDDESEVNVDEVDTEIEELVEEELDLSAEDVQEKVEISVGDDFDAGKLVEEEIAEESEEDDKRYEYIIDDIFKDEVSSEESLETLNEEIESYEKPEEIAEETDEMGERVAERIIEQEREEVVEEQLEDEEEIVAQIRDKVEQFEEDEKASQEFPHEYEKHEKLMKDLEEDTHFGDIKAEVQEELEEEMSELQSSEDIIQEEQQRFEEEKTEIDVQESAAKGRSEVQDKISSYERERAAREVFGDDDIKEEEIEEVGEEPDFRFSSQEAEEEADKDEMKPGAEKISPDNETPKVDRSSVSSKDPIVTSTLGEIYAAQGHFAKAIGVYEILQKKNPENPVYKQKIEELKKRQEESEKQE